MSHQSKAENSLLTDIEMLYKQLIMQLFIVKLQLRF